MKWTVEFFNDKVFKEAMDLPPGIKAELLHLLEWMQEDGPDLGMPYTKALKDGLFENLFMISGNMPIRHE